MRRQSLLGLVTAAALALALAPVAQAADPPPPFQVKTDAEAGCTYGTQPASTFTPKVYDAPYSSGSAWSTENARNTECTMSMSWTPIAQTSIPLNYAVVVEHDPADMSTNEGPCELGAADPKCTPDAWKQFTTQSVTYRCSSDSDLNCVSAIEAVDETGKAYPGTFVSNFPEKPIVAASQGHGAVVPAGGATPLWQFDLPSGAVQVLTNGSIRTNWASTNGRWTSRGGTNFDIRITAVSVSADENVPMPEGTWQTSMYNGKTVTKYAAAPMAFARCVAFDVGRCAQEVALPAGYRFRLTMNMPDGAMLFANGRISEPTAYTEPLDGGYRLIIEAAPAQVPSVAQVIPIAIVPKAVVD